MTKHSSPRVQALFYFIEAHNCGVIHCLETTPLSEVLCLNQHSKSKSLTRVVLAFSRNAGHHEKRRQASL